MENKKPTETDAGNEKPAETIEEIYANFDPAIPLTDNSPFYSPRQEDQFRALKYKLKTAKGCQCHFLSGHRGGGKTTELRKLAGEPELNKRYAIIYMTITDFGKDTADLTHDAVLLEMGLCMVKKLKEGGFSEASTYEKELEKWGREIIKISTKSESAETEAGAKADAWLVYFKTLLRTRREWKTEEKLALEPKIQDLVFILNRLSAEMELFTGKRPLLIVDDLEKGESDAHREMHARLFEENLETLLKPKLSVIFTLPVYYRSKHQAANLGGRLTAFSAVKIYDREQRKMEKPVLDKTGAGYGLMRDFVLRRVKDEGLFGEGVLDDLILIGGGLFRDTARAIHEAALCALLEEKKVITAEYVTTVFNKLKKEYQPQIRGEAAAALIRIQRSDLVWENGAEPLLMSRAVMEYENGEIWLDVRYVLKEYVRRIGEQLQGG